MKKLLLLSGEGIFVTGGGVGPRRFQYLMSGSKKSDKKWDIQ
jgi:hypothetical protein